jgi:hypothetical protein
VFPIFGGADAEGFGMEAVIHALSLNFYKKLIFLPPFTLVQ